MRWTKSSKGEPVLWMMRRWKRVEAVWYRSRPIRRMPTLHIIMVLF